jgi:hypothetical protein
MCLGRLGFSFSKTADFGLGGLSIILVDSFIIFALSTVQTLVLDVNELSFVKVEDVWVRMNAF